MQRVGISSFARVIKKVVDDTSLSSQASSFISCDIGTKYMGLAVCRLKPSGYTIDPLGTMTARLPPHEGIMGYDIGTLSSLLKEQRSIGLALGMPYGCPSMEQFVWGFSHTLTVAPEFAPSPEFAPFPEFAVHELVHTLTDENCTSLEAKQRLGATRFRTYHSWKSKVDEGAAVIVAERTMSEAIHMLNIEHMLLGLPPWLYRAV